MKGSAASIQYQHVKHAQRDG